MENEKDIRCACKSCEKINECELHKDYEENHCENGTYPIDICTINEYE